MDISYPITQMIKTATEWSEQSDVLGSAEKNLRQVQVAALGPRVSGSARLFVTAWAEELSRLKAESVAYSQTIDDARFAMGVADDVVGTALGNLLPWSGGSR